VDPEPLRPSSASRWPAVDTKSTSLRTGSRFAYRHSSRMCFFHEVDVGRYPLFEYPPYDLALAVRMHEVVLSHGLEILHCHYAIPHATSAWIAREMLRKQRQDVKGHHHAHGTDITLVRPGSLIQRDHQILDRAV
jgi:hypothetical protein